MTSLRKTPGIAGIALVAALVLGGCSEEEAQDAADRAQDEASQAVDEASEALEDVELPEVDWEEHGNDLTEEIASLAAEADCDSLQEMAEEENNDTEFTEYVKAQIRKAC